MAHVAYQSQPVPGKIPSAKAWLREHVKYFFRRTFSEMKIPDRPWFDHEGTKVFEQLLENSQLYMEYGSGGSTVLAATLGKTFVSVESDIGFSKTLADRIAPLKGSGNIVPVNIGTTGAWGAPLFTKPNVDRLELWKKYITAPWSRLQPGTTPDLVLIDGRFRVACALFTLIQLRGKKTATILFDDYGDRQNYHVVEKFADLEKMAGRMAVFHPRADVSPDDLALALDRFIADWR
jgi:hypothetical protein